MDTLKPTPAELLESLNRSGYLLESEISKILNDRGYFNHTNPVIKDKLTGKSREVDLVSEFYERNRDYKNKTICRITFVFEIKNNSSPVVLLTRGDTSPDVPIWNGGREVFSIPEGIDYESYMNGIFEELIYKLEYPIYSQYCSFQYKKDQNKKELMALHPEPIHEGLSKCVQYCDETVDDWNTEHVQKVGKDDYFRHFIYLPVLLLKDDLYELHHTKTNKPKLKKVSSSILLYQYIKDDSPEMTLVLVLTRKGFDNVMKTMLEIQRNIEKTMINIRLKNGFVPQDENPF